MRMILADDEPIITKGIQKLIDWKSLGIDIVGEYEDGKSAFEGILCKKPDLALLDISMPEMNGIDILKRVQEMKINTKIIFISGFQDFEYAKSAVKYGAVDYLLKPVIREELMNAVEKCILEFVTNKEETTDTLDFNEDMDLERLVNLEDTYYIPVYVAAICSNDMGEQMEKLVRFSIISLLDEYLNNSNLGIVFLKKDNIVMILKGKERTECNQILNEIREKVLVEIEQKLFFIIGDMVDAMYDIPSAYEKCLLRKECLFFADYIPNYMMDSDLPLFEQKVEQGRIESIRDDMIEAVVSHRKDNFEKNYLQYSKLVCWISEGKKENACFYFCTAIRLLEEKMVSMQLKEKKVEMKALLEKGRNCKSYTELVDIFKSEFEKYFEELQQIAVGSDKQNFLKAKRYIEEHYNEDLTLNILAEEIHMNPYYFSSFFKKNSGENFKDYVGKVRIGHAVADLVSTDKKIYEIAVEVGFSDARAFTEAFQKIYKETPNSYRKRIQNND